MKHVMKISTVAFHAIWGKKELNLQRMLDYIELAAGEGSNLVVFPEMALTGYDDKKEQPKAEKMRFCRRRLYRGLPPSALPKRHGNSVSMWPSVCRSGIAGPRSGL